MVPRLRSGRLVGERHGAFGRGRCGVGSSRRSSRKLWRGGPGGRWRRRSPPDRRASRDAAELDRRVARVRVVDPHHPLYGHSFAVSDRRSGRGPELIVVRLPDGRERSIRRSATDLVKATDGPPPDASRHAHISVRTLLPLANHVRAVLASRDGKPEGGQSPEQRQSPGHNDVRWSPRSAAAPVVAASGRDTTAAGAASGPAPATPAASARSVRGGRSC